MLARFLTQPCAYCGSRRTDDVAHMLAGYPACAECHDYFGSDADRDRLALVRSYRAERRGQDRMHRLNRLLSSGR